MSHDIPDQFEAGDRSSQLGDGEEGRDGEKLINQCCAELGVNQAVAIAILQWADENLGGEARSQKPEARSSAEQKLMAALFKILEYEYKHPDRIHIFAIRYVFGEQVPFLDGIIGHRTPAQYAKHIGVVREAVNKVVRSLQNEFGLAPRKGQRGDAARANMKRARLKQLKPNI